MTTSLVLNIAEGNGRFSMLDHGKFTGIAQNAVVMLGVYLDVSATGDSMDVKPAKELLRRIAAMLARLGGYLQHDRLE
jgi:hypothetical protein